MTGIGPGTVRPLTEGWSSGVPYWFKSEYSGPTHVAQLVYTSIYVPSSGTAHGDQYAELLTVVDNLGYFDQIGLSSDYGCPNNCGIPYNTWTIAWEQGTYANDQCGSGWVTLGRDGTPSGSSGLNVASWYTFLIYLTGTDVQYKVYAGEGNMNSTPVWTLSSPDTATYFQIQGIAQNCYGAPSGEGTVQSNILWEEVNYVASTTQQVPQWDFAFAHTTYAIWGGSTWAYTGDSDKYYAPSEACSCDDPPSLPHAYIIDYSEAPWEMVVANQATEIVFANDAYTISPGGYFSESGTAPSIGLARDYNPPYRWTDFCLNNTCSASFTCSYPSGWEYGYSGGTSIPMSSINYDLIAPDDASQGIYYSGCTLVITSTSPTETTTFIWYTYVT